MQTQNYRPYLGLPARLSLVWLNRWTILLFVIFVQLLFTAAFLKSDLQKAQQEALAACVAVEQAASMVASVPHYMALSMNAMTAKGVDASVSALSTTLDLMLTGVEEIVLFVVNSYKNTYLCLFTLAVSGSLSAVTTAAEDTVTFLNSTLSTIESNILADVASAQTTINTAINKVVSGVASVFGDSNPTIPQIQIPSVSELSSITIPDTVTKALQSLNNSLPTFEEVKNATDNAIKFPFDILKQNVHTAFDNFTFNSSLLPVPQQEDLKFCSNNTELNDFFQNMADSLQHALIILSVVILLAALLCMIPYGLLEWWSWRKLRIHAIAAQDTVRATEKPDYLDISQIFLSPTVYKISTAIGARFNSEKNRILVRWFFAYITQPRALLVLALSLAGFVSCLFQIILLNKIKNATPVLVADIGDIQTLISSKIHNASAYWINGTNSFISNSEFEINDNLLGWARNGSQSLNNTLNTFVDTTVTTIQAAFGNTPLETPVLDVVNCLILMKIQGIQDALTFINENAKVQFPRMENSTFDVSPLSTPSQNATSSLLSIMDDVIRKWQTAINRQAMFAGILLAVYALVVLMGGARVFFALRENGKNRGDGGGLRFLKVQHLTNRVQPNPLNPFEDFYFEAEPGPTPLTRSKE